MKKAKFLTFLIVVMVIVSALWSFAIVSSADELSSSGEASDESGADPTEQHKHSLTITYENQGDYHSWEGVCVGCPEGYTESGTGDHSFTYTSMGASIVEECDCGHTAYCELHSVQTVYDASPKQIEVINEFLGTDQYTVKYYRINEDGTYDPTPLDVVVDAGEYKAEFTVKGVTCSDFFTVEPAIIYSAAAYVDNKDYDGTADVYLNEVFFEGLFEGDDVYIESCVAKLSSADAGIYQNVILTDIVLGGEDKHNYSSVMSAVVSTCNWYGERDDVTIYPLRISVEAEPQTVSLNGSLDQSKWHFAYYDHDLVEGHNIVSVTLSGDTSKATAFGTVYPENAVILDAEGNDVTQNYNVRYHYATLEVVCPTHTEFTNGFCNACGGYEKPDVEYGEYDDATWDDTYFVSNVGQLYWVADCVNNFTNEINVKLVADITINTVLDENARPWTPILNFYGTFDGNFKTVSGLYLVSDGDYVAMFGGGGYAYGTIKNLRLSNSYFKGVSYVGGIAGYHAGEISNCFVDGTVKVEGEYYVGALVGDLAGSVNNCFAYAPTLVGSYNSGYAYINNSYYLSAEETEDGGKTASQFASGEVAFLLQSGVMGEDIYDDDWNYIETIYPEIWGQKLGTDIFPVFGGEKVYEVAGCDSGVAYFNEELEMVHSYENEYGYCKKCHVKIAGASVTIGSDLTIVYKAEIVDPSVLADGEKLAIIFTMNGKSEMIYGLESTDGTGYLFPFGKISPQNMTSLIDAHLVAVDSEGNVVKNLANKIGYSIRENVEKLIELYPNDTYLANLVSYMLTYGAASQEYTDFNKENMANANLSQNPVELLPEEFENIKNLTTADDVVIGDVYFVSATVRFDNVNRIGIKLSTANNAKLFVNGAEAVLDGNIFYTDGILATEFDKKFVFDLYEGDTLVQTFTYSVSSYVYSMMNKTDENGNLTEMARLVRSLYGYGFSAKAYGHITKGTECVLGEATSYTWTNDALLCTAHGECKYCGGEASKTVESTYENGYMVAVFEGVRAETQRKLLSDLTGFTNEEIQATVTKLLGRGITNLVLTVDADADLTYVSSAISSTDKTDIILKVSGVTDIPEKAFANNSQIVSVSFPDVLTMGDEAFSCCANLKNADMPKLTSVSEAGFSNCKLLESVNMPEITSISDDAFISCEALKSASFKKATNIGSSAFEWCYSLESVDIPNATSIGIFAFNMCYPLKEVSFPELTTIPRGTFASCKALKSVYIPKATVIGKMAFCGCESLKTVSFPEGKIIDESAFAYCLYLESVDIPKATSVGKRAFDGCDSLKEASFPEATSVGDYCFYFCYALTKANFPKAQSLGYRSFGSCEELSDIYFPEVETIGEQAFLCCESLTKAEFPKATNVCDSALYNCENLKEVYFPKATKFDDEAFAYCENLRVVHMNAQGIFTLGDDIFYGVDTTKIDLCLNYDKKGEVAPELNNVYSWHVYLFKSVTFVW